MRGNIPKLYISNFLTGLVFWYSVEKLFMYTIGIDAFGVSVNAVALVVVTTLFEVPSGVLADRWNRKYTLFLGIAALGLSSLLLGASHGLAMYLAGTVIYGLYLCLTNGTFQALMYDSLKEDGKTASYVKHQGASYGLFMIGIAIASPLGGYIADSFSYQATYYLSALLCAINLLVVLSMREPKFHKLSAESKLRQHIGDTWRTLVRNPTLLYLSCLLLAAGMLRSSLNEYAGLYFIAIGFGAIGSGWANGGKWLFGALGQFLATKLARWLPAMIVIFFVAFAAMSAWRTPLGLVFFYLATFTYGVIQNESQAMIQDRISSGLRATALSVINFGTSSLMIPLGLVFGWVAKQYDVFRAYQVFAVVGLVYLAIWVFWQRRVDTRPAANAPTEQVSLT